AADAAWTLALMRENSDDAAAAVSYARRALDLSPYDEGTIQRVLRLLDRVGDRASAKRVFDTFVYALRADLDIEPSPATVRLARSLIAPALQPRRPSASDQSRRDIPRALVVPGQMADGGETVAPTPTRPRRPTNLVRHVRTVRTLAATAVPTWTRATA